MHNVLEIQDSQFQDQVLNSPTPVLVDFFASWCPPCRALAPQLESAALQLAGRVRVVKVNTEQSPSWASRFGIQGVPTLLLFREGKVIGQQVGFLDAGSLVRAVEEALRRAA